MWSEAAKAAAEVEFGRRNYRTLAFIRSLPLIAGLAAVAALAWAAHWVWTSWHPAWSVNLAGVAATLVAIAVLLRLATRSRRRGYRMPRRY
jgi:uncharacterized membrane protein YcjF (UPF0283 family)